jgi:6-phosphofructokinase
MRGAIGTLIAIAASISTTATGFLFEALGNWAGFLILAAASAIATALLWLVMPETRPANISIDCCNLMDVLRRSVEAERGCVSAKQAGGLQQRIIARRRRPVDRLDRRRLADALAAH